ncbi:MAG: motility associated factor glycosyltransferase family protein [Lachnospiraceae bacterium]|nr:motility associated factor glycosyltransferase family protein [Lachnospiraceae bacterium]
MDNCFGRNMEALRERHAEIRDALMELRDGIRNRDDLTVEAFDAGGRAVLAARRGDAGLYQLGSMYSDDMIIRMWEKLVSLENIGYMAKMIFFGIGNGSIVRRAFALQDDTLSVMVYEPSLTMFYDIINLCDISDVLSDPRLVLFVEGLPSDVKDYLYKYIDVRDLKRLHYQPYTNYKELFKQEQKDFVDTVQILYNSITATQSVLARYGKAYFDNSLRNIKYFVHTRALTDLYLRMPKDIPCILVASGPSLDKNIHNLKGLKGKAFMIAADSAVRVLLKHDIIPDMFVSMDGNKNQNHFQDPRVADIPILTEVSCNYRTLDKVKAPMFFYNDLNVPINEFLKNHGIILPYLSSGGSVAHAAYAMVTSMQFQNVILVGQDLAYTDNKTHSTESVRGEWNINTEELDGYMTEGYYGGKVKTSYEFQLYREWFEENIAAFTDTHTINATEGGALIKGAENMPLAEAVERYCTKEYDVNRIIAGCADLLDDQLKDEFFNYMQKAPDELREIAGKVRDAIRDYDKILQLAYDSKLSGSEMKRLLRRVGEVTTLVEEAPFMYYIQNFMQEKTQKFLEQVYEAKKDVRTEVIDTAKLGIENFRVVLETIQECLPKLDSWRSALEEYRSWKVEG